MATADALLSQIKARCFWPASGAPLTDAEILSFADAEIVGSLWPDILASQGDYYVDTLDYAITADYARYRLPPKAYGPIKDILIVYTDDTEESVPLINLEQLGHNPTTSSASRYLSFIEGDYLGLTPVPSTTSGTLRIRYYRHPSTLCLTMAAREISSVDLANGTFGAIDGDDIWSASDLLDVIGHGNAHQVMASDLEITLVNAATVEVDGDLSGSGAQIKDWLSTAGTTPLVQVPDSMIPLLAYRSALACLSGHGDMERFKLCMEWGRQSRLEDKQVKLLEPRSESEPRSITTAHSALWLGRTRGNRGWR